MIASCSCNVLPRFEAVIIREPASHAPIALGRRALRVFRNYKSGDATAATEFTRRCAAPPARAPRVDFVVVTGEHLSGHDVH